HASDPQAIHEGITGEAIRAASLQGERQLLRNTIENIEIGTENTDVTHQWDGEYHFDNASTRVGNGAGFKAGFAAIAKELAAGGPTADGTDEFFGAHFTSLGEINSQVRSIFRKVAVNPTCLLRRACPTAEFARRALDLSVEPLLGLNPNPDP